jgi:hypothetical protein
MQQMNAQWVITSIAKELSGYELLRNQQDNKHPDYVIELWKEHMLRRCCSTAAAWIKKQVKIKPNAFQIGTSPFPKELISSRLEWANNNPFSDMAYSDLLIGRYTEPYGGTVSIKTVSRKSDEQERFRNGHFKHYNSRHTTRSDLYWRPILRDWVEQVTAAGSPTPLGS